MGRDLARCVDWCARPVRAAWLVPGPALMLEPIKSLKDAITPSVLLSDRYPKRFAFAAQVLRRDFIYGVRHTPDENAAVETIVARLKAAWADSVQGPAQGVERFRRAYVLDTIIASGRFEAMAAGSRIGGDCSSVIGSAACWSRTRPITTAHSPNSPARSAFPPT